MNALETLVTSLRRLPGVGKRAAQKMALQMLLNREEILEPLKAAMTDADRNVKTCHHCGNLDITDPCAICNDPARANATICVVPEVADLWALERTHLFKGQYHVLGGLLSAINGVTPDKLRIHQLIDRVTVHPPKEIIFALPASVEGQSTVHQLMHTLESLLPDTQFTRLAHGLPVGGHLETMDEGTLAIALKGRAAV